jgi:predicted HD phosphohydrolase
MEDILEIYKKYGNSDYIGEKVSQIEHALQSALLAEKMYPTDYEFIIACLLHDIGHIIPEVAKPLGILGTSPNPEVAKPLGILGTSPNPEVANPEVAKPLGLLKMDNLGMVNHQNIGANFLLKKGFPSRIIYLVASHVDAKRYLISKNPTYFSNLSLASCKTLNYQGGPMNDNEINEFESNPWFKDSVLVRYIDDLAKIKGATTKTLDDYKEMINNIIKK